MLYSSKPYRLSAQDINSLSTYLQQMGTLIYFRARGNCDQIRLLLEETGYPYKDISITPIEYVKMQQALPFGQIPVWGKKYEINERQQITSLSIVRYINRGRYLKNLTRKRYHEAFGQVCFQPIMKELC